MLLESADSRKGSMITRLGFVGFLLTFVVVLLGLGILPLSEMLRGLLLTVALISVGALSFFRTEEVMSPIFASSKYMLWSLKVLGLIVMLVSLAGFIGLVGIMLGFW